MTQTDSVVTTSMREFLNWVAARPRSYAETMEAWRTSCPRFSVWEDASIAGFVALQSVASEAMVVLTPRGSAVVADA